MSSRITSRSTAGEPIGLERRGIDERRCTTSRRVREDAGPCAAGSPCSAGPSPADRPFSPPTAPRSTALDAWTCGEHLGRERRRAGRSEHPPMRCSDRSNVWPPFFATASSTRSASAVTSGPMPSPGSTTNFALASLPSASAATVSPYSRASTRARQLASMMFGEAPTVLPAALAVLHVHEHARRRRGAVLAVEDADLVVDELQLADARVARLQRLAQCAVERGRRAGPSAAVNRTSPSTRTFCIASARRPRPSRCSTFTKKSTSWNGSR